MASLPRVCRQVALLLALSFGVACRQSAGTALSPTDGSAAVSSAAPAAAAASDAVVHLGPGQRFERGYERADIPITSYRVQVNRILLEAAGDSVVSISLMLIPNALEVSAPHLDERIEVVDASGAATPVPVQFVEESPRNGGGKVEPVNGAYVFWRMHPSVFDEVRVAFKTNLTPAARALRFTFDSKRVEVPLRFGPPTRKEVPEAPPEVAGPCDKLATCCASLARPESVRACNDIADSAKKLGMPAECTKAAASYCR